MAVCVYADCSEYCQFEAFNATCPKGQLVVVDEARYGRQRLGRCVTRDYGFIGCTANVIDVLDAACTGRTWCEVPVPSLRRRVQPCPKDLTAYLDATYHCIHGMPPPLLELTLTLIIPPDLHRRGIMK